ncbi:hypothetical protein [Ensifer canadensis]
MTITDAETTKLKRTQDHYNVAVETLLVVMKDIEDVDIRRKIAQQVISIVARRDPMLLEPLARDLRAFKRVILNRHFNAEREAARREAEEIERNEANGLFALAMDTSKPMSERIEAKNAWEAMCEYETTYLSDLMNNQKTL